MAIPGFLQTRVNNLDKNIKNAQNLLEQMQQVVTLAGTRVPLDEKRLEFEILQIKAFVKEWESEYFELSDRIGLFQRGGDEPQIKNQLKELETSFTNIKHEITITEQKLNNSTEQVIQASKSTRETVGVVTSKREELVAGYNTSQQELLMALLDRMDESQLKTLTAITNLMATIRPKDARVELEQILASLEELKQHPSVPEQVKQEIEKVKGEIENQDSAKESLKLALPLIPAIVDVASYPPSVRFNSNLGVLISDAKVSEVLNKLKEVWSKFIERANLPAVTS